MERQSQVTVAFIAYGPVDRRSGGYLYDNHLISALEERGHSVRLVSQTEGTLIRRILENGRALTGKIDVLHPDLIIADELNHPSLFLSMGRIMEIGAPVVAVVHHLTSLENHSVFLRSLFRIMEWFFLRRVDACIFNSEETGESVIRLLGSSALSSRVIYPGADNPIRDARARSGPMRILFVGNIIPRKGLDRLLKALSALNIGTWELDIVGSETTDPKYSRFCRSLAEKPELRRFTRFHGRIDEGALDKLREDCEVLAVPSDHEGFGIVYLEAMRAGMIPVASGDGGAKNLIVNGVSGFLVSPDDPESLETILRELEQDRELRLKIAGNARRRGEDFPDWKTAMNNAVDFLEEVEVCR